MLKPLRYAMIFLLACGCSCSGAKEETPSSADPSEEVKPVEGARLWVTTADKSKLFAESSIAFGKPSTMSPNVVKFTDETFQSVDGFGAAVTISSCYNILKMSKDARTRFLRQVFDPQTGAGVSLIRICIGGSDFSIDRFTWCDEEGLEHFAPHQMDVKYVLPVLKEIFEINPDVKIIGSPWTAPRWMKLDANLDKPQYSWTGGRLNPKYYEAYGEYFVKWIQYFEREGFPIYAVTPQNEPLNAGNSMSMLVYWDDCAAFVKKGLGPALQKAGLKTKILIFDHNYNYDNKGDQNDYPLKVYADPEASKYIAGSAWHNYGGSVSELDQIAAAAPDKEIYFTEASIGTWNYSFEGCLLNDFRDIFIGTLQRGCKGITLWNLMLDDKNGPYTNEPGSCTTCWGAVTVASSNYDSFEPYTHYYNIAHCSKVIRPGAVRIGTSGRTASGVKYQAYRNTDGSYGVIFLSESSSAEQFVFVDGTHSVSVNVPARCIASVLWK